MIPQLVLGGSRSAVLPAIYKLLIACKKMDIKLLKNSTGTMALSKKWTILFLKNGQ